MEDTIRIKWEGPNSLNDMGYVEEEQKYSKKNQMFNNDPLDFGIYQIYGQHPVYGSSVLLYIGKAQDQTFAKRISQEAWEYNEDYKNIQIYLGRIYNEDNYSANKKGDSEWNKRISQAEKMLIYAHEPAGNSSNILNVSTKQKELKSLENIRVLNYGQYRSLMPEISGEIWVKEYEDWKLFGK